MPAVLVAENLPPASAEPQPNTFYIEWGIGERGRRARRQCCTDELGVRDLVLHVGNGAKAWWIVGACWGSSMTNCSGSASLTNTEKYDYTQSPSADLGTSVFWNQPTFQEATTSGVEDNTLAYQGRAVRRAMYEQAYQDGRAERRASAYGFLFLGGNAVMSTSPLRPAMVPVTRQMRAYFAPVNRITETPTIFDPAASGAVSAWIRRLPRGWTWAGSKISSDSTTRRRM